MPNIWAFLSYVVVTTFTPGPNNIMSMANASRHGFARGIRFVLGVSVGFFLVIGTSIAFTIALYRVIPVAKPFMTAAGAAYILWLAWKTVRATAHDDARGPSSGPCSKRSPGSTIAGSTT